MLNLKSLRFYKSQIDSLRDFKNIKLKTLHLEQIDATDFENLNTTELTELSLRKSKVQSLNFLSSAPVEIIFLSQTFINDRSLESLSNKPICRIDLFKCEISKIDSICQGKLEEVCISGTGITNIESLSFCPLKKLEMRATKISDLSALSNCPLEVIHLPGSEVTSLESLRSCPVKDMNIVGLDIKDFSPLLDMPIKRLKLSIENLTKSQINILKNLDLVNIISPGDPEDQSSDQFFDKLDQ